MVAMFLAWAGDASAQCKPQSLGGLAAWARVDLLFKSWSSDPAHSNLSDWEWKKSVDLGDSKPATILYGVTHMGNGTITLKNLFLRVYRGHEGEGFTYNPTAFQVYLRPWPSGCRLLVFGNVDFPDGTDKKVIRHGKAALVYDYHSDTGRFRRVSGHAPIRLGDIDLSD